MIFEPYLIWYFGKPLFGLSLILAVLWWIIFQPLTVPEKK